MGCGGWGLSRFGKDGFFTFLYFKVKNGSVSFPFYFFLPFLEVQNGFETVGVLEVHVRFDCRISVGLRYSSN